MKLKYCLGLVGCLLLYLNRVSAQLTEKHYLKEIGWTVTLPQGFRELSIPANTAINARGQKAMEKKTGKKMEVSGTRTLLSARKDRFHFFNCTITPFDVKKDGNWNKNIAGVKRIVYETLKQQMPGAKFDSVSVKTTIDGLAFDKFTINMFNKNMHVTSLFYTKLYKGYDVGITFMYAGKEVEEQFKVMLDQSKFTR